MSEPPNDRLSIGVGPADLLGLAGVPARAREQPEVFGDGLFDIDDETVVVADAPRQRDVGIVQRCHRQRDGFGIAAGIGAVDPTDQAQLAGLRRNPIAKLQLGDVFAAIRDVGVEPIVVGDDRHQEIAGAERPIFLIQLRVGAPGVADLVHRQVVGPAAIHVPVHEIGARIVGVGCCCRNISITDIFPAATVMREMSCLPGSWFGPSSMRFLFAAESEGLAHEDAGDVQPRVREARLLRLAVRIGREPEGVAQAEALHQLGIDVELHAVPQPDTDKCGRARGVLELARLPPDCFGPGTASGTPDSPARSA